VFSLGGDVTYEFGGVKFRLIFSLWGYAPHYAENVIDPLDGHEKFVFADPHIRHSVIIYNPVKKEIEWEFKVPGNKVVNPHIAHMVTNKNPLVGPYWDVIAEKLGIDLGDIICADMNNEIIVIDRDKKVKKKIKVSNVKWLHDVIPSKGGDGLIIDDYSASWVRKIDFNGSVIWGFNLEKASKITVVYAKASSHIESFGGDYLVASNSNPYGIYEFSDSGKIVWQCPPKPPCLNATWMNHPHTAFRYGLAEGKGNLTVVGFEAGGGIIAVDRDCRPRWGFMKTHTNTYGSTYEELYRPSTYGFFETTHVFPLLNGNLGAIDWRGKYLSQVIEITSLPRKTTLLWLLAWDYEISNSWVNFQPPIEISEWDQISFQVVNVGSNEVLWEVLGTKIPQIYHWDYPTHWYKIYSGKVKPKENSVFEYDNKGTTALLVRAKSQNNKSVIKIIVTQKTL